MRVDDGLGAPRWVTADLLDFSPTGMGIALTCPLAVGVAVKVNGRGSSPESGPGVKTEARVAWCLEKSDGTFRAGLQFDPAEPSLGSETRPEPRPLKDHEGDYYELLELDPGAHTETIQKIYRILAQRYHPDNAETGDAQTFQRLTKAYQVLRDPDQRANYDASRAHRKRRWRAIDRTDAWRNVETEQKKRREILAVLYATRLREPDYPALSIHDLEDFLGCPKYHLQMGLWYLKEKEFIDRNDRGRYEITAEGVDRIENDGLSETDLRRLISSGELRQPVAAD